MESLYDLAGGNPAVDAAFNNNCIPACIVATCSCTQPDSQYWSSTSVALNTVFAWVAFSNGGVNFDHKTFSTASVRAVRSGL